MFFCKKGEGDNPFHPPTRSRSGGCTHKKSHNKISKQQKRASSLSCSNVLVSSCIRRSRRTNFYLFPPSLFLYFSSEAERCGKWRHAVGADRRYRGRGRRRRALFITPFSFLFFCFPLFSSPRGEKHLSKQRGCKN